MGALFVVCRDKLSHCYCIQPSIWLPNLKFIQKYPAADDYEEPSYKNAWQKKKNKNKIKFQPHAECTYMTFFITFFWH